MCKKGLHLRDPFGTDCLEDGTDVEGLGLRDCKAKAYQNHLGWG